MLKKLTAFFSVFVIFIQMLMGGYPLFGGKTQEFTDFVVTGSISENVQSYTFPNPSSKAFNRFTLHYSSNTHVRGTISYIYKTKNYVEEFYMEPGQNQVYSSFIDGYLTYGCGKNISKISIQAVDLNENAVFNLDKVISTVEDVFDDYVFIENSRYKLGASLLWGGAIAYLEDFNDNDPEITNLINMNDTGRLVQQSYYGTSQPPYEPGEAFGHVWPYNPVQGGNKYNENSKIIDIKKDDNSLYIKSRAREWAKTDFTYCYMENTYELFDTHVKVSNRFVDYSPYSHPVTSQECPAFYTISALNRYVYYDGTQHWQEDELTYRDDLGFWGDPKEPQINKQFTSADDESWSAFVNADDWGFGVFTPGAYAVKAGRYEYNGTKKADVSPTNYIAPLGRFSISHCEPVSYQFYLASGSTNEMRKLFFSLKDSTQNEIF